MVSGCIMSEEEIALKQRELEDSPYIVKLTNQPDECYGIYTNYNEISEISVLDYYNDWFLIKYYDKSWGGKGWKTYWLNYNEVLDDNKRQNGEFQNLVNNLTNFKKNVLVAQKQKENLETNSSNYNEGEQQRTKTNSGSVQKPVSFFRALSDAVNVLAEMDRNSQSGTLHAKAEAGWLIPGTVTRYTVKVKGDSSTGYFEKEDSSGNGFWDASYVTFYSLPMGHYDIIVSGYDALEKIIINATFSYENPASGDMYCTVNPDGYPKIRCEKY